jgi:hypothetical protein
MYKLFNALNGQQFVIRLLDNAMIPKLHLAMLLLQEQP